ncbi:hypothetical protein HanIR_Chr08g0389361 [Helianthus annuus]|nr:hypothetical protein HanIR_Chr08g0389361 [Helianthus annuus]
MFILACSYFHRKYINKRSKLQMNMHVHSKSSLFLAHLVIKSSKTTNKQYKYIKTIITTLQIIASKLRKQAI